MGVSPAPGGLATEMISPGTSSSLDLTSHLPSRYTTIRVGVAPMPRRVQMFLMREKAVAASNMSKFAAENRACFQYSSRSQSRVGEHLEHADRRHRLLLAQHLRNVGSGTPSELSPKRDVDAATPPR